VWAARRAGWPLSDRSRSFQAVTETTARRQSVGPSLAVPSRIPSRSPHHRPQDLTAERRAWFRDRAVRSRAAKAAAASGLGPEPLHLVNVPRLDPLDLMQQAPANGLRSLSLFSGGGGLDLGFERAGYDHAASYEILQDAADTIVKARPDWEVHGGDDAGDVRRVAWGRWRGQVDVLHGGPPCQPFSNAGRQQGHLDPRDMWPEFVRAVRAVRPAAFVGENVPALAGAKFSGYVRDNIVGPLADRYTIVPLMVLRAQDFGVPQVRRRVFFVGFRSARAAARFAAPARTHVWPGDGPVLPGLARCMGVREALGLPAIGADDLAPTVRSTLTGPRHTTSILNSVSAARRFAQIEVWPSGVAPTREKASAFVAENGHFRLSVPDVALLQWFPDDWPFVGATYMQLGQIGNAVPPPLAYAVASSVAAALVR
jgi:DNA (cytosine-5)-methyltransferase 1